MQELSKLSGWRSRPSLWEACATAILARNTSSVREVQASSQRCRLLIAQLPGWDVLGNKLRMKHSLASVHGFL